MRYRRPYQTRHTYASMMLSAGESPMWVAQQMGHSDWTMIARVYGRWIPEAAPDAGQKAVKIFAEKAGISAANAGKSMPASEIETDKNQGLTGGRAAFTMQGYRAVSHSIYPQSYPRRTLDRLGPPYISLCR